ncbi:hypothetical protein [Aliarcobacter butzleri]|uniref:hypothetical protein n=1 Tax=Aliarcobacter butzleri TaxID=28197 RepID=UPI00214B3D29|nr:hypothetical protein [Aliarcobacter butzleri]MCP3648884.1 hypothetical protein [Arcobacter sp. DNRA7]MCR1815058.1 hypothetical protein [Aliarcobacter butzleri]
MLISIDKNYLFNLFGVDNFSSLETIIDNMAPSLVEYHLSSFHEDSSDTVYFNKRDIEKSFLVGDYTLYLDYSENLYLELVETNIDEITSSFW